MHPWFVKEAFSPQAPSQLAKEVSATDLTSYLWDPAPVLGLCQDFPRDLDEAVMKDSRETGKGRNLNLGKVETYTRETLRGRATYEPLGTFVSCTPCIPGFSSSKI